MKGYIYLLMAVVLLSSCAGDSNKNVVINGSFPEFPDKTIYIAEVFMTGPILIDSLKTDEKGEFSFVIEKDSASVYMIDINLESVLLPAESGDKIFVKCSTDNPAVDYEVSGSRESELLKEYQGPTLKNKARVDSIREVHEREMNNPGFEEVQKALEARWLEILEDQKKHLKQMIDNNPASFASLIALNTPFATNFILNPFHDSTYIYRLDSGLMAKHPGNVHTMTNHRRVARLREANSESARIERKLMIGRPIPDVSLPTPDGNEINLHSVTEQNKVTVLFSWISHDRLSRESNQELKKLYDLYHGQGLEIYAISFDKNKENWTKAIAEDNANWIHVSDLKQAGSPVLTLYNIDPAEGVHYFYILDRRGQIVNKGKTLEDVEKAITDRF